MKKRDFPRAIVFGLFIGAGAYICGAAWQVTFVALPFLGMSAALCAFVLSLFSGSNSDQQPAADTDSGRNGTSSSAEPSPDNAANADQQSTPFEDPNWWCDYDNPFSFQRTSDEIFNKHH